MRILTVLTCMLLGVLGAHADQYDEAVALIKDGKFTTAQIVLEAIVQKDEGDVRALYALGYAHEKQDHRNTAVEMYRRALVANLTTGRNSDDAERAMKRLFELQPRLKPVLAKAWELETEAAKADGQDRKFLTDAARLLYNHALNADISVSDSTAPPVGEADIEEALGYALRPHKVNSTKLAANGHYYMMFEEFVSHAEAMAK